MITKPFLRTIAIGLMLICCFGLGIASVAGQSQPAYRAGEVLVRFKSKVDSAIVGQEAKRLNSQAVTLADVKQELLAAQKLKSIKTNSILGYEKLICDQQADPKLIAGQLASSALVDWAEPNYRRQLFDALPDGPDDYYYELERVIPPLPGVHGAGRVRTWWVDQVQADRVFAGQLVSANSDIIIAILDSGVRLTHEDFVGKIVTGYDFANSDSDPTDDHGHGTHVAGIAAAMAHNGVGVPGIGYLDKIKIMPIKVTDSSGSGYDSDVSDGIQWAVDHGAKVINMSFGGPESSETLASAIEYAHCNGCVIVAAAGNNAQQLMTGFEEYGINPIMYPASYDHIISVAATNTLSARAAYSEYNDYVDIAAPGGDFFELFTNGPYDPAGMIISTYYSNDAKYEALAGTSMASPIVAGAAALLLAQESTRTPDEIEALIISTADKIGSLSNDSDGYNEFLGWGQLNLYKAINQTTSFPLPTEVKSSYNYPNPFNPARDGMTNILIPKAGEKAQLIIYNVWGYKVKEITQDGTRVWAGNIIQWDGRDDKQAVVANGVYPYVLKIDNTVYQNKIAVKQ